MDLPQLVLATNNKNKVIEIRQALNGRFNIVSLKEAGIDIDIPEPYDTLEENATQKSRVIYQMLNKNCFSEDSGLEIDALGGAPGVKSARYADGQPEFEDNMAKVLHLMQGQTNRKAKFRTVISLIVDGKENQFEGICNGQIIENKRGTGGFGYDPIFVPEGESRTFAEMDLEEKSKLSHRKKAVMALVQFLTNA